MCFAAFGAVIRGSGSLTTRRRSTQEVVDRLFDRRRDPNEPVRPDDWFAPMDAPEGWKALFAHESVGGSRRWFANLKALGEV